MKVTVIDRFAPKIYISEVAHQKMQSYIKECSDEVGWLATVQKEDNDYIIKDTFLFKQEVHATTCEITTEGLTEFATELLMLEGGMDIWNDIKCWCHSHVNMGVTPSAQDDSQMKTFEDCGHDFFIRLIGNKKGDYGITLYDYERGIKYSEMSHTILYDESKVDTITALKAQIEGLQKQLDALDNASLIDETTIKAEMKEKVSKKSYYSNNKYQTSVYDAVTGKWITQSNSKKNTSLESPKKDINDWYDSYYNTLYGTSGYGVNDLTDYFEEEKEVKTMKDDLMNACNSGDFWMLEEFFTESELDLISEMSSQDLVELLNTSSVFADEGSSFTKMEVLDILTLIWKYFNAISKG